MLDVYYLTILIFIETVFINVSICENTYIVVNTCMDKTNAKG